MTFGLIFRIAAIALVAAASATTTALARHRPVVPLYDPNLPQNIGPPPWVLYPQPRSTAATDHLPKAYSQVPLGRAVPGVTPYEMLPNKP